MEAAARRGLTPSFLLAWVAAVCVAQVLPILADEAYYLAWFEVPALGYFDHPPAIAWWTRLVPGHPRAMGLVLVPLAFLLIGDASRRFGLRAHQTVPGVLFFTPLGLAAAALATPDAPATVVFALALWGLAARNVWACGVGVGLCLWCKLTPLPSLIVLVPLFGARSWIVASIAALVASPVLVSALANDGAPFAFQIARIGRGSSFLETLAGLFLVATPGFAVALVCVTWRVTWPVTWPVALKDAKAPADEPVRTLRWLTLAPLSAWLVLSVFTRAEVNFTGFVWPPALLWLLHVRPDWRFMVRGARLTTSLVLVGLVAVLIGKIPGPTALTLNTDRLAACRARVPPELPLVAARYQEKALLDATGSEEPLPYLRAVGHRLSEYDRRETPSVPTCGFLYLGDQAALGGRCDGERSDELFCGRAAVRCDCR